MQITNAGSVIVQASTTLYNVHPVSKYPTLLSSSSAHFQNQPPSFPPPAPTPTKPPLTWKEEK